MGGGREILTCGENGDFLRCTVENRRFRYKSRLLAGTPVVSKQCTGGRVLIIVHDRSRTPTILYRISHPYSSAGTEHVGFSPTRQISLAPSAKRREVFGESREG
ncbi:unnamed protein product [Laminaria digitata]